ncbi:hypothetical protein LAZ67_9000329 [Cordylochernes scorpioides]|uniref:Uncharacterized protein n=1 Tax=Cordylochernes scorpioides TaxID=51811 RepID=A0ABY6KVR8_9ARAC|nr:hypothetical protein LAZ67_9000329 [Cordylochernes scorpioides]
MIKSKLKCLLITFFDAKGLVLYEFVPFGRSGTDYSTLTSANRVKCVRGWLFLISQENGLAKYQGPEKSAKCGNRTSRSGPKPMGERREIRPSDPH